MECARYFSAGFVSLAQQTPVRFPLLCPSHTQWFNGCMVSTPLKNIQMPQHYTDNEEESSSRPNSSLHSESAMSDDPQNGSLSVEAVDENNNGQEDGVMRTSGDNSEVWTPTGRFWYDFLHFCGPGWLVSIAYIDPGNYQADLQAGATSRYSLLFAIWWTSLLSIYVQVLCVRLTYYSRDRHLNLAQAMAHAMPKLRHVNWFIAEVATILTDLPEVIGIGIAFQVLFHWPYWLGVILSLGTTMVFLTVQSYGIRTLEMVICGFVGVMSLAVWVEMGRVGVDMSEMMGSWAWGFADMQSSDVFALTGILGSVVMPHNLFLHTQSCQSRRVAPGHVKDAVWWGSLEPVLPIIVSFFVNLAILAISAERLYGTEGAENVGLADFHKHFARFGQILWAIALLAAGQSSAITTTYTGQSVMSGFIELPLSIPVRATVSRLVAITPCVLVSIFIPNQLNQMVNIVNSSLSFLLPFAFSPLVRYNCSEVIMGEHASKGWEKMLLGSFAFGVWLVNSIALSVEGGGFFGDMAASRRQKCLAFEVALQVFYAGWNIYCFWTPIAPLPEAMDGTEPVALETRPMILNENENYQQQPEFTIS